MRKIAQIFAVALAVFALAAHTPAKAQTTATPQHLQAMIAAGQEQEALAQLQTVLQAHPDSGVAWYLSAEAQDAAGNEAAARTALANAEQFSPGLPFARPAEVAALQSHINGTAAPTRSSISPMLIGIIGVVFVFLVLRMLARRRRYMTPPGYQSGYGTGAPGPYPYGSGPGMGLGVGPGMGIGGSILGGLAAGAGFAAGERVIGDMFGGGSANADPLNPNYGGQSFDPNSSTVPGSDRDDGLMGSPGWDAGSNGSDPNDDSSNFDPGNNW